MNAGDFRSGVWVPLLQALTTGVLTILVVWGAGILTGGVVPGALVLAGGVVSLFMWLRLLSNWLAVYYPVRVTSHTQPVSQHAPFVSVEVKTDNRRFQFFELPANEDQLSRLADGVLRGVPLSESAWCGSGRPFSKLEFHALRDELLKRQLVAWKNEQYPSQGLVLTLAGRHVFQHLVTPTLPAGDQGVNW